METFDEDSCRADYTMNSQLSQSLLIAQYEALRSEIGQRLEQRQQVLTFTLLLAGSLVSIGLQPGVSTLTVLCYGPLAFFLSCVWAQHTTRIGQITLYLYTLENTHLGSLGPGWESYRRSLWMKKRRALSDFVNVPARGLFVGSELLAVVIGMARFTTDRQMSIAFLLLLIIDSIGMLFTLLVLHERRERTNSDNQGRKQ